MESVDFKNFENTDSFNKKSFFLFFYYSHRASAVAIGQALLEAGYVVCISQLEQVFVDDYVLYRPMRPSTGGSEQTAQEGLNRAQDGGQEPLWVKQITSMAESIGGSWLHS